MPKKTDTVRFRFVQMNDMHVYAEELGKNPYYSKIDNERVRWLVGAMNEGRLLPRPDFVLGLGDLIDGETFAHLKADFEVLMEMLRPLRCPFYPCYGNHEVMQNEGDPEFERVYRGVFGDDRVNYTFEHEGIEFVVFSNGGAGFVEGKVRQAQNEWLRGVLEGSKGRGKILCCHVPLVPLREEEVLKESFGFVNYKDPDPEALKLVDEYGEDIIAVLSGHLHLTGKVERNGVTHIVLAGTGSYPSDFGIFAVYEDRIEVEVREIPGSRLESNIHGRPRHPRDYTDAKHRSAEEYVRGLMEERKFTIELGMGKRTSR